MATPTPADLPDDIEELRALLHQQQTQHAREKAQLSEEKAQLEQRLEETVAEYRAENERLAEYIRLLKRQHFGPSSERTGSSAQPGLFNEAEALTDAAAKQGMAPEACPDADDGTIDVPAHKRRRGGRKPLPEALPRRDILHDLEEHEKVCGNDPEHALVRIGEDVSERLVYEPAKIEVERHVRPRYACGTCKDGVSQRPPAPSPIPKSMATPSLLAEIAASKFVDGLPLARQEKILARIGIDLPRQTMAAWMIRCAGLAEPLVDLFLEAIRRGEYVLADETPFQVLKEKGKRAQSQSYLWALRREAPDHPLLYYEYAPTRSGEVARGLLEGFKGYLQTDGYAGYDGLGESSGLVHVGCFAHARRKFDEALRGQPNGKKTKTSSKHRVADQGLSRINALFKTERSYRDARPEERHQLRQEKLAPLLDALREWTTAAQGRVPPTSLTGKAIDYLDGQWPKLVRVLEDGRLELSTNAVERAIRPFVVGRKAWLFADTPSGATASARLYSLVETAKANGVEPWRYLEAIFTRLPLASTRADYEALMPWRLADELREARAPVR